jgi:hypothetical protein
VGEIHGPSTTPAGTSAPMPGSRHQLVVGQLVRISGRPYRVFKVGATVDGQPGMVLLAALTKSKGSGAGEGGDLLALTPEEIVEQQVVPTSKRRPGREVRAKASQDEGQSLEGQSLEGLEGQSSPGEGSKGHEGLEGLEGLSIGPTDILALLIFIVCVVVITLMLR